MFPGAKLHSVRGKNYGPRHHDFPTKLVLHTTETTGVPGYNSGAFAPHYTFNPKTLEWWYHGVPETDRVGTLVGSSTAGVKTNELSIQVEIICYSAKSIADASSARLYVGDLSNAAKDELARFVDYCRATLNLGPEYTPTPVGGWKYGTTASTRMSKSEWLGLDGFTAHGAVPGNSHYDTGVLDLADIEKRTTEDDMSPEQEAAVNWLVTALKSKRSDSAPWGAANWRRYLAVVWPNSTAPGPLNLGTHIQLSHIWAALDKAIDTKIAAAIEQAGAGVGLSEQQVKDLIAATKLVP